MRCRNTVLVVCLLGSASLLRAQVPAAPGHWEGAIHAPFGEVGVEIDLAKNAKGEWIGTFSRPSQNLRGIPLSNIAVNGRSVAFELKVSQGGGPFDATVAADGKSMSGVLTTYGATVPFDLKRAGDAKIDPPAKSERIGKELEGTWNGALDSNGTKVPLVLTMSNQADGTAHGSMVNPDDGIEFPITIVQKGSNVTIDIKNVGSSYSAILNSEATELAGTFTQGAVSLSLTLHKK